MEALTAYAMILPALAVLLTFAYWPAINVVWISLTDRLLLRPFANFVGLENYARLLHDERFWNSVWNTVRYVLMSVPLEVGLALAIAVALARPLRGVGFFRTAFFLPVVTSLVAVAMVWEWIYHPSLGLLNALLAPLGVSPVRWLGDPTWAMPALVLLTVWKGTGYYMVIYLAGILDIPEEYYEAARIDGAGRWHIFRHVTWPLLSPTTYLILVLQAINSFQVFASVYTMTGGGPLGSTEVVVFYLYERAFKSFEFGYASAISVVLFVFLLLLTGAQRIFIGRRVIYDR
ncbi:ABC-type sugar transport system permease subunit [Deinobacterium chartae]|uniref:ABC-type sugar transport system permease subunit n=1 Tax=Deinobacterium chartae TaxID=521158 RepID=A0A841HUY1_9DEIO|nr:ABC-type sugar transport system permease subunit [Deinobacterium chartae]